MRYLVSWYRENLPALFIDIFGMSVLAGMWLGAWVIS